MADASQSHRKPSSKHTGQALGTGRVRMYPQRMIETILYTGLWPLRAVETKTGLLGLVFWAEQVNQVHVGDVIRIESGWCRSRDGALVVSTGKHGKLSIVSRFDA